VLAGDQLGCDVVVCRDHAEAKIELERLAGRSWFTADRRCSQAARDELLQTLWGRRHTYRDRSVDVFVRKLREKIDLRTPRHTFVQTRYGVGYKLEAQPKGGSREHRVSTVGENPVSLLSPADNRFFTG